MFYPLHKLFEEHYDDLAGAVDEIAERIRTLDYPAPGSFKQFLALAELKENETHMAANAMIAELLSDHEQMAKIARAFYDHANGVDDQASASLFAERMEVHEKIAWMLRAQLQS